jgi:hypothetical protein
MSCHATNTIYIVLPHMRSHTSTHTTPPGPQPQLHGALTQQQHTQRHQALGNSFIWRSHSSSTRNATQPSAAASFGARTAEAHSTPPGPQQRLHGALTQQQHTQRHPALSNGFIWRSHSRSTLSATQPSAKASLGTHTAAHATPPSPQQRLHWAITQQHTQRHPALGNGFIGHSHSSTRNATRPSATALLGTHTAAHATPPGPQQRLHWALTQQHTQNNPALSNGFIGHSHSSSTCNATNFVSAS